ncbi:PREDICTED: separin, partial [Apaloderma vittatum]
EEGQAILSVRLQALRFLLLLEKDGADVPPLHPPFFATRTAQHAATAASLYQDQRALDLTFFARQLGDCLLAALREEVPPDGVKQKRAVKQQLCYDLQLLATVVCDAFQCSQMVQAAGGKLPQAGAAGESPDEHGAVAGGAGGGAARAGGVHYWVRIKTDATKQGAEELRLRTLKEGLGGHNLDAETLVTVLFEELKAYKAVRGDTGQERYNVLCDLLEKKGRLYERAVALTELAQVLCYHSYAQQTDCSSLDSVREALRLLELVPESAENRDRLLDERAQALLWFYICTLEAQLEKSIERDQRAKAQGSKNLDDCEPNDLNYEGRMLEDRFLYDGISFNLATETALSKHLDDAFASWKQLLVTPGIPAVRSPEQTVTSLNLLAALYKLMAKPLQAIESYLLVKSLCDALGDSLAAAGALCQVTKLLFQLECPSYAQLFLEEVESRLQKIAGSNDSSLLLQQTCLLLRSQLCCVDRRIDEGLALLLEVLQNPALQKNMKAWYLLRAHVLWLVAVYLSLPPTSLSLELRQRIFVQGWKTPKTALMEAQKLFRGIIILLLGNELLGSQATASDVQFVAYGDNLLLKWQVLADLLACSEQLVALLGRLEVVCNAKAFCLEALKLAMKLQTTRWCTSFLVLKAQLELQQDELEQSHSDLRQALFLLESDT